MKDDQLPFVNETIRSVMSLTSYGNETGMKWCIMNEESDANYKEFYEIAQTITGLFIYPMTIFPGLVGNTLTIFVLSRRNMRTSTNAFLSALAVSDSLKLINDMLYFFVTVFLRTSTDLGHLAYGYLYPYAHFVFTMSVFVSSWLTVSVAVERYILVCHPTRARALWNRKRAVMLCVVIYVIMTSLALPSALRYRTIRCLDPKTNISQLDVEVTELWQNELLKTTYDWAQNLIRSIIPLLVLVVLNVCIISALRRTKARKRKNSRHRVTIMMLVVILAFLVCITPDAILSMVFGFGYHEAGYLGKGIREITDSLLTINAGVNFLIYCAFNQVFRKSFARLCFPKKRHPNWNTELDESTYRRLSEAKSLLSSNNNSPPRHDTPPTVVTDSSKYRNIKYLDAGNKSSGVSSISSKSDGGNQWMKQSNKDQFRQSVSSLLSFSSSNDSHYNNHQHHQHRVSSSGLKKSRNSVKSNRAKNKGSVTFCDNVDINRKNKPDGSKSIEDVDSFDNESSINTTSSSDHRTPHTHTKNSIQCSANSSQISPDNESVTISNDVNVKPHEDVHNVDTCDAHKLANFTICDGSHSLTDNLYSGESAEPFQNNSDTDYTLCLKESVNSNNKKCYLSVLFIDNTSKDTVSVLAQEQCSDDTTSVTSEKGDNTDHVTLSNKGSNQTTINCSNAEMIEDNVFRDSDYLASHYLHGVVLTTDV